MHLHFGLVRILTVMCQLGTKIYCFFFLADGKSYSVQVKMETYYEFYIGESAESKVCELYSDFNVNGVRGWGVAEWQYRNVDGLPKTN